MNHLKTACTVVPVHIVGFIGVTPPGLEPGTNGLKVSHSAVHLGPTQYIIALESAIIDARCPRKSIAVHPVLGKLKGISQSPPQALDTF